MRLLARSSRLNGLVERANRTHRGEFWELHEAPLELPPVHAALRAWHRACVADQPNESKRLTLSASAAMMGAVFRPPWRSRGPR